MKVLPIKLYQIIRRSCIINTLIRNLALNWLEMYNKIAVDIKET